MTIILIFVLPIILIFVLPTAAYLIMKHGTVGFYRGKEVGGNNTADIDNENKETKEFNN